MSKSVKMSTFSTIILLSIVLCYQSKLSNSLKILGVFPFAGKSHFAMYERLMKELAVREHQVDVISTFPLEKPLPNYRDIDIRAVGTEFVFNNMSYTGALQLSSLVLDYLMKICGSGPCDSLGHPNIDKVLRTKKGAYDVIVMEVRVLYFFLLTRPSDAP